MGGFLRSPCETQKCKMRSDKCKKGGFESFLVVFVAYESLLQWVVKFGACFLVHSWDISFSILEHSTQCWGSVEASRGGMLEVIGGVGSRSGLC